MNRMKTNRLFCGALLALTLIASQTVRAEDKEVTLTHKHKEGDATRYQMIVKGNVSDTDFLITSSYKLTVKEIKKSGEVVLLREEESRKAKIGEAEEIDSPTFPPATLTRDKRNRLLDYKADQ